YLGGVLEVIVGPLAFVSTFSVCSSRAESAGHPAAAGMPAIRGSASASGGTSSAGGGAGGSGTGPAAGGRGASGGTVGCSGAREVSFAALVASVQRRAKYRHAVWGPRVAVRAQSWKTSRAAANSPRSCRPAPSSTYGRAS